VHDGRALLGVEPLQEPVDGFAHRGTESTVGARPPPPYDAWVTDALVIPPDDPVGAAGIERLLVVTAHPDDVDFGASATIAAWVAAGVEVTYAVVTNGDAGGFDPDVPRAEIPGIRQAEQRAAAAA